jgi:hypothetical protein
MGKESVRASDFIHENIHKDVAIDDPNDPELTPLYYHTLGSRTVNNILHQHYRGETEIDPKSPPAKHIKKMDKVLKRFILSKPAKVYTGIPVSVEHAYEKYKADRSKPIKLHLPAYTSATTKFLQAISFSVGRGNNILMIELPIGTPAVSLKKISSHEYEKEVLLPRGIDIKVQPNPEIITKYGGKIYVWKAVALGHSPIEIFRNK